MRDRPHSGPIRSAARGRLGLGAAVAALIALVAPTAAAQATPNCLDMAWGSGLACCLDSPAWTQCVALGGSPITPQAFLPHHGSAYSFHSWPGSQQIRVWGGNLCALGTDHLLRCSQSVNKPELVATRHRFDLIESDGDDHLCGIHDGNIECLALVGANPEVRAIIHGTFSALALDAEGGCGIDAGNRRCWTWPRQPAKDTAFPVALETRDGNQRAETGPHAVSLANDASNSYTLLSDGSVDWTSYDGSIQILELPGPAAEVHPGFRGGCAVQRDRRLACWVLHGNSAKPDVALASRPLTNDERLFVGGDHAWIASPRGLAVVEFRAPALPSPSRAPSHAPSRAAPAASGMPMPRPFVPSVEWVGRFGLPFSLGHGVYSSERGDSHGLWFGLRAQALFERIKVLEEPPYQPRRLKYYGGAGLYAEVSRHPILGKKRTAWAAGVIGLRHLTPSLVVMPSLGVYQQDFGDTQDVGIQASFFAGALADDWAPLGLPFGIRVDVRYGLGDQHERAFLVSGVADAVFGAYLPVAAVMFVMHPVGSVR